MNQEKFAEICKKLEIKGIHLANHEGRVRDDFAPGEPESEGVTQSFSAVTGVSKSEQTNEYIFKFSAGVRLVEKEHQEDSIKENTNDYTLLEVKADFYAVYSFSQELNEEELQLFAEHNVVYNVWPYWREYVQNTCFRMNIPPFQIPFFRGLQVQ